MSEAASKRELIAKVKRAIRPIVESWYMEMKKKDKNFKKLRNNEENKVITRAARQLVNGRVKI